LFKAVFHAIIVLCILTAQVGSTFAVPEQNPCEQMGSEHMAQMEMAQKNMTLNDGAPFNKLVHGSNMVPAAGDNATNGMLGDCCEHECGCSAGLLTIAMAINQSSLHYHTQRSSRIISTGLNNINLVLPHPQRPPKT
jgi:hypothetical protein